MPVAFLSVNTASAANIDFSPSLSISEEVNDNIYEVANNKRKEFITRLQPGLTSRYEAPLWHWDLAYNFDYRRYERNSRSDETTHNLDAKGNFTLVDNRLYLDVSDTYHRVSLDVARNVATESSLFLNQVDQNIATISPYLLWRPGSKSTLKTGYRFVDARYWDSVGIERQEHSVNADLTHEISSKFSLSAGYAFTRLESQPSQHNKHDISGGFRFEYAERSFIYGQIGNSWQHFNVGTDVSYFFWNAGITHDLGVVVASLETRVQDAIDPLAVSTRETSYNGRLEKTLQRGMIGFSTSYTEFVNSQTDQTDQRRLSIGGTARYEIIQSLIANVATTAERFYVSKVSDSPYHLNATGGLSYIFNHDLTFRLNYTYDSKRNSIGNATGAIDTNRIIVEVRKTF